MAVYAVLDKNMNVVNTILWDGVTPFPPPSGCQLVPDTDPSTAEIGGTYTLKTGVFNAPGVAPTTATTATGATTTTTVT